MKLHELIIDRWQSEKLNLYSLLTQHFGGKFVNIAFMFIVVVPKVTDDPVCNVRTNKFT